VREAVVWDGTAIRAGEIVERAIAAGELRVSADREGIRSPRA